MMSDSARKFLETGCVVLDVPRSFSLAKTIAQGFQFFLADNLPEERLAWSFNSPDNEDPDGSPDDGFIPRGGEDRKVSGGRYDAKNLFHYRPRLQQLLKERGVDTLNEDRWFATCDLLYDDCVRAVGELAYDLDRALPGYQFFSRFASCEDRHVIRIIEYSPRGLDDPLIVGKKHADRNFLTLQVAESQKGLRIYRHGPDEPAVSYEAERDRVLAFPSKKFESLTEGKVKALHHDIVNENPTAPPRWSVIFFSHINL